MPRANAESSSTTKIRRADAIPPAVSRPAPQSLNNSRGNSGLRTTMHRILFFSTTLRFASACADNEGQPPGPPGPTTATYQGAVRTIFEQRCSSCHVAGGIGPFALDSYQAAKDYGQIALQAIRNKEMPPWPPD